MATTSKNGKNNLIKISNYIDDYYREYSIYTNNNRAIPSIVDGFKPVQRKIIYCALKESRTNFRKVSSLAGLLPSMAAYHHGDAASQDAIVKMTQTFNQNLPFLEGKGTFGTRLVPIAAAPRYIFSRLNENFDLVFKDSNVAPRSLDEEDHPEPLYYLPIIPTVLLNGINGVAVGFSTNILPRSPKKLTKACINYLKTGKSRKVEPTLKDFKGEFEKISERKYRCKGIMTHNAKNSYTIEELPLGSHHEKYIEHLDNLKERGIVKKYVDDSDSVFNITVELDAQYNKTVDQAKLDKDFKLSKILTETLCVLQDFNSGTEDGKIRIVEYQSEKDIISDFCDFRLGFYEKRIDKNIERLNNEIRELEQKIEFIREVVDGKIKVGKLSKSELVDMLKSKSYDETIIEKLISMAIYQMTKDNIEKLLNLLQEKKNELGEWKNSDKVDLYIKDLENLDKKLKF